MFKAVWLFGKNGTSALLYAQGKGSRAFREHMHGLSVDPVELHNFLPRPLQDADGLLRLSGGHTPGIWSWQIDKWEDGPWVEGTWTELSLKDALAAGYLGR